MSFHRSLILAAEATAPALARKTVREWLEDLALEELREQMLLVTSELVTNAILHARTELELSVTASDETIEVGVAERDRRQFGMVSQSGTPLDNSTRMVQAPEGGGGLLIVKALTDDWGVAETPGGKRVWARWSAMRD